MKCLKGLSVSKLKKLREQKKLAWKVYSNPAIAIASSILCGPNYRFQIALKRYNSSEFSVCRDVSEWAACWEEYMFTIEQGNNELRIEYLQVHPRDGLFHDDPYVAEETVLYNRATKKIREERRGKRVLCGGNIENKRNRVAYLRHSLPYLVEVFQAQRTFRYELDNLGGEVKIPSSEQKKMQVKTKAVAKEVEPDLVRIVMELKAGI